MPNRDGTGPRVGGGGKRMGGPVAAGPGGYCVCKACGYREAHVAGSPCSDKSCPKCGTNLVRES
jgi:hypothetical protein